jgi:IS4 transposase
VTINIDGIPATITSAGNKLRWTIELFFRWLKFLLSCRHWLAESRNGVAIQAYCALIAALVLSRHGPPEISK